MIGDDKYQYHAFGWHAGDRGAAGGFHDFIGSFTKLDAAKEAVELRGSDYGQVVWADKDGELFLLSSYSIKWKPHWADVP